MIGAIEKEIVSQSVRFLLLLIYLRVSVHMIFYTLTNLPAYDEYYFF